MSEQGWLAAPSTLRLWDEGPHREWSSERKLRLWACACCRRVWELLPDPRSRRAVEVAELLADGLASEEERAFALAAAESASERFDMHGVDMERAYNWAARAVECAVDERLLHEPEEISFLAATAFKECARVTGAFALEEDEPVVVAAEERADLAHADLLREIIGNPFQPEAVEPAWLTDTVRAIAAQMYESHDFGAMPILADALQDAGCGNDTVLAHCRDAGAPHVRGCWVVDLLLGKK